MIATECYPFHVLKGYVNGNVDEELIQAIERHLQSCGSCEDTVSELSSIDDTLIRTLQLKSGTQQPIPVWLQEIAELDPNATPDSVFQPDVALNESQTQKFGDYELTGTLGRGGMSVVFSARHKHLGRDVALKILMPTTQQRGVSRERFSREMRVNGGLTHPSIIRATDAGEFENTLYLVMDQVNGVDLKNLCRSQGPLAIADVCAIGVQVAQGLHHAHSRGIVHRDIKPSNLMLDRDGNVKILDFGLARIQSSRQDVTLQTTIGQLLGTLDYMAPEQANGSEVGPEADIYALGATIFKLLAGTAPHGRSANVPIIEFLNRLANEPAPPVDTRREQVPPGLSELVHQMLQTDPQKRSSSAQDVAEQLTEFATESDLPKLIASVPDQAPKSSGVFHLPQELASSSRSLDSEMPPQNFATTPSQGSGPYGPTAWAIAAASLFGLIWLAITMSLKSPEGEFRIESEVLDSLTVEVVGENDRVDLIAVDQGTASTSLRAGRYRIRLDRPTDEIKVAPNEVTISKDKVAIVKITRLQNAASASNPPTKSKERDQNVALSAKIELMETIDELQAAKKMDERDEAQIAALNERVIQLRALSQPIPSEPVFKGRTLSDWTAQMRYEQDRESKEIAIASVLSLGADLPQSERIPLLFEAKARQKSLSTGKLFSYIRSSLSSSNRNTYLPVKSKETDAACEHFVKQLLGEHPVFRNYAILVCVEERDAIRKGAYPGVLEALANLASSKVPAAQLAYAFCHPDSVAATAEIMKIDLTDANHDLLESMLIAVNEPTIQVDAETQFDWSIQFIAHPNTSGLDGFAAKNCRMGGPLSQLEWTNIDQKGQALIDRVADQLLNRYETAIDSVGSRNLFATESEHKSHYDAATLSRKVTDIVLEYQLGEQQSVRASELIVRRIEQLILVRDQTTVTSDAVLSAHLETPLQLATAVLLLGGDVPNSYRQSPPSKSFYFKRMSPSKEQFDSSQISHATWLSSTWYPYQTLQLISDGVDQRGVTAWRQLYSTRDRMTLTPVILDFLARSDATNLYEKRIADFNEDKMRLLMQRHPNWVKKIRKSVESGANPDEVNVAMRLLMILEPNQQQLIRSWIRKSDSLRNRIAFRHLNTGQGSLSPSFSDEISPQVAAAIERIAKLEPLESSDIGYLRAVAEHSPNAVKHASDYVQRRLKAGEFSTSQFDFGLLAASKILAEHPNEIRKIETKLRSVYGNYRSSSQRRGTNDMDSVGRMLKALEKDPPEKQ